MKRYAVSMSAASLFFNSRNPRMGNPLSTEKEDSSGEESHLCVTQLEAVHFLSSLIRAS